MNTLGTVERPPFRIAAAAAFLVGMGGLAFTLTLLWLSMRVVLGVGAGLLVIVPRMRRQLAPPVGPRAEAAAAGGEHRPTG